ncbi:hypothetical protein ARMSODRAFT_1089115 [Armillaria solidipes]|uniref:Uncharacterized protein n=1 Tax=Armillaria solidipes TaxID=1076256 RepID=A0A2H3B0V8_9AGAR|nr:hypothetical protein ARMSODRAFT_1089115 [Armillaria solidipes]
MAAHVIYPHMLCIYPTNEVKAFKLETSRAAFLVFSSSLVGTSIKFFGRRVYIKLRACLLTHALPSAMRTSPPDLSQDDRIAIFHDLDLYLNTTILQALLHGLYTGIVAITLWTIFSSPTKIFLRIVIITLYALLTIAFAMNWAFERRALAEYSHNYYSVYKSLSSGGPWITYYLINGITGGISTLIVDVTITWRCWALWDRKWRVVLIPIICAVAGTTMKTMQILTAFHNNPPDNIKPGGFAVEIDWSLMYILTTMVTTVICTILILYRIVRLAHRLSSFRSIISSLIESSAMYSLVLIVYLTLVVMNLMAAYYADTFATYIRAIAPTLLVLRVAAGSNSRSSNEETTASTDLSVICFTRMEENSPVDVGDRSSLGSHSDATEIV